MAKRLEGITIEIDGNTTGLSNALKDVNSNIANTNKELKSIDKLLKFDPGNSELLAQKQKVLSSAIKETVEKLEKLKTAKEQADERIASGKEDKNSASYRELEREIIQTEQNLQKLTRQSDENEKAMNGNAKEVKNFGEEEKKAGESAIKLGDLIKANLISDAIKGGLKSLASELSNVASSFTDALKNGAAYADNMLTMSTQTGLSVESLQKYQAISELVDVSTETLTGSMAKNIKSMSSGKKAYEQLGVSVKDANGNLRDSETVYWESIDALGKIEDSTQRDALAMEIFGKSAQDLNPLIAQGSAGIKELSNEAEKMGAVLNEDGIKALGDLDDEMQKSAVIFKSTGNIIASAFAPAVSSVLKGVNEIGGAFNNLIASILSGDEGGIEEATNQFVNYIETFINNISEQVPRMLEIGSNLISTLINVISDNLPKILEVGIQVITTILNGITNNLDKILPVVIQVILTLANAIIQNLPTILEAGIQVILSLINGIAQSLPDLIPTIVDAIILMVETILDNMDQIIDAGIAIILGLADGLMNALPRLIDKIPDIIDKLVMAITNNLPKLIEMGIKLNLKLAEGLIKAIPQLISKIPQIISSLVEGLQNGVSNIKDVGKRLIEGLWNGIKEKWDGLKRKVEEFGNGIVSKFKSVFGIKSPSRVMRDEVGKYLTEGIGVGIEEEVPNVIRDVNSAMNSLTQGIQASVNPTINPTANTNPLIIQIENFNNTRESDIQSLAEELEFYRRNSAIAKGGN